MLEAFEDQAGYITAYDPTLKREAQAMLRRVRLLIGGALLLHGRFQDPLMEQILPFSEAASAAEFRVRRNLY